MVLGCRQDPRPPIPLHIHQPEFYANWNDDELQREAFQLVQAMDVQFFKDQLLGSLSEALAQAP